MLCSADAHGRLTSIGCASQLIKRCPVSGAELVPGESPPLCAHVDQEACRSKSMWGMQRSFRTWVGPLGVSDVNILLSRHHKDLLPYGGVRAAARNAGVPHLMLMLERGQVMTGGT